MSPYPITQTDSGRFITVERFGAISEKRFREIQAKLVEMLRSKDRTTITAALYCIDKSQSYCPNGTPEAISLLIRLGYIQDDLLIENVRSVGRAGFTPSYPGETGHIRGYRSIDPFSSASLASQGDHSGVSCTLKPR